MSWIRLPRAGGIIDTEGRPAAVDTVIVYSASLSLRISLKSTKLFPQIRPLTLEGSIAPSGVATEWKWGSWVVDSVFADSPATRLLSVPQTALAICSSWWLGKDSSSDDGTSDEGI